MIALDTNILVYAHRRDSEWHREAAQAVRSLADGTSAWAIPWPCIHEFVAVVTHPKIYRPPSSTEEALDQVAAWLESPSLALLSEGPGYEDQLLKKVLAGRVVGPKIHDARIAALCAYHGVRELWSADRDFSRFSDLDIANPLAR